MRTLEAFCVVAPGSQGPRDSTGTGVGVGVGVETIGGKSGSMLIVIVEKDDRLER